MMLVWFGGRERTREEYERLLTITGLKPTRIIPTVVPICILEAVPVD